jgi:hypothetical protein
MDGVRAPGGDDVPSARRQMREFILQLEPSLQPLPHELEVRLAL